jgi:ribulose-5-phosphate 4-epimerase/fuculose-1-phosphate aldolase
MDNNDELNEKLKETVETARLLFERREATGSTGNISFRLGDRVYINARGCCFGTISAENFVALNLEGQPFNKDAAPPSVEWHLHLALYKADLSTRAVIHTHSFYSALWSCLEGLDKENAIPRYTPYLQMKLGPVRLVPYAPPGSQALFDAFDACVDSVRHGYLLANHGNIIAAKTMNAAFYALEEMEESCHTAWELRRETEARKIQN